MSDLTLKALGAALFVLAVLGAVFLESLPARATPADAPEVDKGAVILTDVIKDIRPKRSGSYGLIPRSAYIENHGEIIPVLLNSGPSEFRIILAVLTWQDVTTQVNGALVKMRVYYDQVPRSSLPELHNR